MRYSKDFHDFINKCEPGRYPEPEPTTERSQVKPAGGGTPERTLFTAEEKEIEAQNERDAVLLRKRYPKMAAKLASDGQLSGGGLDMAS